MTAYISEPGIYNLDEATYFADPVIVGSLSNSEARRLLPPSCPAKFKWAKDNPSEEHTDAFDVGKAAHRLVLGAGPDIVEVKADSWRTKDVQQQRDEAHEAGKVPLLTADYERVCGMAEALRAHPVGALFAEGNGQPEQTLVWQDTATEVWRRARLDWLPTPRTGRTLLADYKSTKSAEPRSFSKALFDYGYFQQAAWYLDGAQALGRASDDAVFLFIAQEKTPPYVITPIEVTDDDLRAGRTRNARALEVYRDCVESDVWPGYTTGVVSVSMPPWAAYQLEAEEQCA